MSKHTPGPWEVTDDGCIYFKDGFIGEAYDFNPGLYGEKEEKAPMMANARLMAAAPEMYEFIKDLASTPTPPGSMPYNCYADSLLDAVSDAKGLIAKIEGDE